MNPISNPFSPGAGTPPPDLVGRASLLDNIDILLGRLKANRSVQNILLTGLRGVGKTVLLTETRRKARRLALESIYFEASEEKGLSESLMSPLKNVLFDLDRMEGAKQAVRKGLVALRNFLGTIHLDVGPFGLDIAPQQGLADSGDLESDLTSLFLCVGEAAAEKSTAIVFVIDEVQCLPGKDFGALIMALHRMQQERLPVGMVGAGLPILPSLAGTAKSYAERLFQFPKVGALDPDSCDEAIRNPFREAGVEVLDEALDLVRARTKGYPYFVQEWGYQLWNGAKGATIGESDVHAVNKFALQRLDDNFFRVRMERLTDGERAFLRAMSRVNDEPIRIAQVAKELQLPVTSLGPRRGSLIKKGMIYSPAHGEIAFTVPLFNEYLLRNPV